jgi:hypothetical protein
LQEVKAKDMAIPNATKNKIVTTRLKNFKISPLCIIKRSSWRKTRIKSFF